MTLKLPGRLVLVGAGKMGGAMLEGWLDRGLRGSEIVILDPGPPREIEALIADHGITHNPPVDSIDDAAVVLLAVKPQIMDDVLPTVVPLKRSNPVFLSIAAGKTIANFEAHLTGDAAIVRAMPNTPAAVSRGITVICPNPKASAEQTDLCRELLEAVGAVAAVEDEGLLDAVTGVSGSGPAYVFLLAECMAAAGVKAGLPEDLATQLARATVCGAGELMHQSPLPAGTLRENVTSPNGTTAAALDVLRAPDGMEKLLTEAIQAATKRSRELAG